MAIHSSSSSDLEESQPRFTAPLSAPLQVLATFTQIDKKNITPEFRDLYKNLIKTTKEELINLGKIYLRDNLQVHRLQREANLLAGLFKNLSKKVEEARMLESEKTSDVRFISKAIAPKGHVSPYRSRIVLISTVVGFLLSILLAFVKEAVETIELEDRENAV